MIKLNFKYQIFYLVLLLSSISCKSQVQQCICFDKKQAEYNQDSLILFLRNSLKDSVQDWVFKDLKLKGQDFGIAHGFNSSTWEIDKQVLFNKNKTRAILSILQVFSIEDSKMDFVKLISAEYIYNKWNFYYVAMPVLNYNHSLNGNKSFTYDQLSKKVRQAFIEGGYFKNRTCKINYTYIDDWITENNDNMYKWHQNFLATYTPHAQE